MAKEKRNLLVGILPPREPAQPAQPTQAAGDPLETGRTLPTGVGLKAGTVAALDDMAGRLGVSRNELMKFAIRYFITQVQNGQIDMAAHLETQPVKRTLRNPD